MLINECLGNQRSNRYALLTLYYLIYEVMFNRLIRSNLILQTSSQNQAMYVIQNLSWSSHMLSFILPSWPLEGFELPYYLLVRHYVIPVVTYKSMHCLPKSVGSRVWCNLLVIFIAKFIPASMATLNKNMSNMIF